MKHKGFFIILLLVFLQGLAQETKSKADQYFFSYAFKQAITAYETDMAQGVNLSPKQRLNLADAYFKTGDFEKAGVLYSNLFLKDSIMNNLQFNQMLQSLTDNAKSKGLDSLIFKKLNSLSKELAENADFNIKLLKDTTQTGLDFNTFNLQTNTPQADFSTTFYNDMVLFTSGRPTAKKSKSSKKPNNFLNVFQGQVNEQGQVINAQLFKGTHKTKYHKATPYYAKNLGALFYIFSNTYDDGELAYTKEGKNSLALGLKKDNGSFNPLLKDLSTSFYYPFYDEKSQRLYFAANFENGYGGTDLYYVYTNEGQVMSAPINLGPRINSPGNEISPYIFENSLYFSSDVFYGLGGMDIYKSNMENLTFSIPVNLGPSINSVKDDFGFIIKNHNDGLLGYFSSNRSGGRGQDDIYGFMVAEKPGLKTFALKGRVITLENKEGVANAQVTVYNNQGTLLQKVLADDSGYYSIEVPWQNGITIKSTKKRYSTFDISFDENQMDLVQKAPLNLGLTNYDNLVEQKEGQTVLKLKKFYFGKNQTTVTPTIAAELDKVVEAIAAFPQLQLRIETHTDSRGGSSTNFRLTQKRSDNIKQYLFSKGVSPSNILYSIGYGEDKILNNCRNGVYCIEYLHKENQRSLIVVLNDNVLFQ